MAAGAVAALVFVPWPANLMLCGVLYAFLLALLAPAAAVGLIVASIPLQSVGAVQLGLISLTITKMLLFAALAAWALRVSALRRPLRGGVVAGLFAAYVGVLCVSIVAARSVPAWAEEVYRWAVALAAYLVASDAITDTRSARPAVIGTAVGALGACAVGLYQVAASAGPAAYRVGGLTRAYSTFGQPNPFAGYLEVTVPLLVALAAGWLSAVYRPQLRYLFGPGVMVLVASAAVVGLVTLALTQSRGGWVGAMVGLGAIVWLTGGAVRWVSVAVVVAAVTIVLAAPSAGWITARVESSITSLRGNVQVTPKNFAIQERLAHMRAGIAMARAHPWLGVGAGNFTANFRDFTPVWRFRVSRGHAHNAYIQAAAQSGLVGLVVYLALLGAVGVRLARALRAAGRTAARVLVIGAIGVSLAFAFHNLFDYLHVLSLGVQLSAVWALAGTTRPQPAAGAQPAMGMVS